MAKIRKSDVPLVNELLLENLRQVFRDNPVKDDDSLIAIGRNAGRQEVIQYVSTLVRRMTISGDPEDLIRHEQEPPSRRLIKSLFPGGSHAAD